MPMRRTIGISLAFLVISAGAMAKTPENSKAHHSRQPHSIKPGEAETRIGNPRTPSCKAAHGFHARFAAHHGKRVRRGYAASDSNGGPPDAYLGPVYTIGRSEIGAAAWYNRVGSHTSSGELLDTVTATAAHRSLPLASYAKVTNLDSGRSVVVKINDRGPWSRRFIIDLSPRAADELDVRRTGVAAVIVEPVATGPAPADDGALSPTTLQSADSLAAQ